MTRYLLDTNILIYYALAACALVEGCILVTRNVDDFSRIDGLNVLNPFD